MTVYINQKENGEVETVDEFDTMREATEMLKEYQMAFHYCDIYISSRCTRWWKLMDQKRAEATAPGYGPDNDPDTGGDSCWQELALS